MPLEHMICAECGATFDDDVFADDPTEAIICPLCGTVALEHQPVEDRALHLHPGAEVPVRPGTARYSG